MEICSFPDNEFKRPDQNTSSDRPQSEKRPKLSFSDEKQYVRLFGKNSETIVAQNTGNQLTYLARVSIQWEIILLKIFVFFF